MPLFSLPDECFSNILSFLDKRTLYNCLFVNRHWCRLSVPIVWNDPFPVYSNKSINTLMACLNEDEISSLIPYTIKFNNNNQAPPLFDYGKFVGKIDHEFCVSNVIVWLEDCDYQDNIYIDYRIQKMVNVIYHVILRQGSNIREFDLRFYDFPESVYLPKFSMFTTYKPGITNLRSFKIGDTENQNTIGFLTKLSKFCNGIINCELWTSVQSIMQNAFIEI